MTAHYSPKTQLKGLIVFIILIILLVLTIQTIARNEDIEVVETKRNKVMYNLPSYDEKIEIERKIHLEKLSKEMIEAKKRTYGESKMAIY